MMTALLLLACCQDSYVDDEYAFKVTPPVGWDRKNIQRQGSPVAALWVQPSNDARSKDAPPDFTVRRIMTGWPESMEELQESVVEFLKKTYQAGFAELWRSEEVIGGMPAFLIGARVTAETRNREGKVIASVERFIAHAVIQRTLLEHFIVHLSAPVDGADAYRRIYEEAVRSFRSLDAEPTAEQLAAERKFTDLRPSWQEHKARMVVDDWFSVYLVEREEAGGVAKLKLGYYHVRSWEADVDGSPGIAFETRLDLTNLKKERAVTVTSGAFRYDLSAQRATSTETFSDSAGGTTRRHELSAKTAAGGFAVTRDVRWRDRSFKEEKTVEAPPGTVMTNVIEFLRRPMAGMGREAYFARVWYMAEDRVRSETLTVYDEATTEIRGVKRRIVPAHSRREFGALVQHEYSPEDGVLRRERIGSGPGSLMMDRTDEDEALKAEVKPPEDE